ncbi:MAG: cyclic nucleotide-binding domain-containing protein [Deltaproteobacteria bacterium]|jgi:cAMP-dependent protein kinase regulator|nr:cyclic nucleotide-binding domain-containing protein [Deltaproteobacteria bacterium]MBT6435077.1 cyclic nucleotide-binding domain-containing protein [Deltaproteobacteria bacterium]MBT6489462.1 cyclic nucleotide-binding domain-containing protein [Deltaproteobacteria bacterium]
MREVVISETTRQVIMRMVREVYFMNALEDAEVELILGALKLMGYNEGETIIKEGSEGNSFYIILEGDVRVVVGKKFLRSGKEVARLGPGDFFGETALVSNQPRNATVICDGTVRAVKLERSAFESLKSSNDNFSKAMDHIAEHRQLKTS